MAGVRERRSESTPEGGPAPKVVRGRAPGKARSPVARPLSAFAARLRRQVLAQPGITPRPVCPGCGKRISPDDPDAIRAVEVVPVPGMGDAAGEVAEGMDALFHPECFGGGVPGFRRL